MSRIWVHREGYIGISLFLSISYPYLQNYHLVQCKYVFTNILSYSKIKSHKNNNTSQCLCRKHVHSFYEDNYVESKPDYNHAANSGWAWTGDRPTV